MVIGIDFDNTIIDYNAAFFHLACEKKVIPEKFPVNKLKIRDYLREIGKENAWIEMQGIVYGSRLHEATIYPGFFEFISEMQKHENRLVVISHKTRYPFSGKQYDLHQATYDWIKNNVPDLNNIFLELTKKEKIDRIKTEQCDVFIDDLPEIFMDAQFPGMVRKILFDTEGHHINDLHLADVITCKSWKEVLACLK